MTSRTVIDVERLLEWTYRSQKARIVIDHGVGLHGPEAEADGITQSSSSCLFAVERFGRLGCFVDGGGYTAGAIHEDAETVHAYIRTLAAGTRMLLIKYAEQGGRPAWGSGIRSHFRPEWKSSPAYDDTGAPAAKRFVTVYRSNRPWYCPVRFIDRAPMAARMRTDYVEWHAGLTAIAKHFQYHPLRAHLATGPDAQMEPWAVG